MEKTIRVLHYIKHLETGGGEGLIFNIYQHTDRTKVQFDFAVNTKDEERLDDKIKKMGGRIYPIVNKEPKFILLKLFFTSNGLKKLLREKHYDIVHIHCSNGQGLYYSNLIKNCGVKNVICHIHNTSVVGRFEKIKTIVHNYFRKKYMYAPTEYLACSSLAAKWLYDDSIINGAHYMTLKNGIDVEKFKFSVQDRTQIREQLGFQGKKVICTIGRCVKEKNQIYVLRVLEELLKVDKDYRLIIIGQGYLEGELKNYAKERNIGQYVSFIKSTDEVEKYLSASDDFLLSSSASEGLGIVAIEAQANGLHTIVSDNVPDDVLISPYIRKINLSDGEYVWAKDILDCDHDIEKRLESGKYVRDAGYEIQSTSNKMQDLYIALSKL